MYFKRNIFILVTFNIHIILYKVNIIVTSRPQDFNFLYFEKKEFGIERVWKDVSGR